MSGPGRAGRSGSRSDRACRCTRSGRPRPTCRCRRHDDVAGEPVRRARSSSAKCGEPDSSSPSISSLRVTAGAPAGRGQMGPHAEGVEQHLALVVGGAARDTARRPDRPARTAACPTSPAGRRAGRRGARRRARSGRRGRRRASRRRPPARPAVSQISTVGNRPGGTRRRATRRCAVRPARARGRRRSTGCAATRPDRHAGRTVGLDVLAFRSHAPQRTCSASPHRLPGAGWRSPSRRADRRGAGCGWRASTCLHGRSLTDGEVDPERLRRGQAARRGRPRPAGGRPRPVTLAAARPHRRRRPRRWPPRGGSRPPSSGPPANTAGRGAATTTVRPTRYGVGLAPPATQVAPLAGHPAAARRCGPRSCCPAPRRRCPAARRTQRPARGRGRHPSRPADRRPTPTCRSCRAGTARQLRRAVSRRCGRCPARGSCSATSTCPARCRAGCPAAGCWADARPTRPRSRGCSSTTCRARPGAAARSPPPRRQGAAGVRPPRAAGRPGRPEDQRDDRPGDERARGPAGRAGLAPRRKRDARSLGDSDEA